MKIHIVQKGDTLWKIAKKYGVNFEELKKMNSQLSNPDMIMPGMKIKVPTTGGNIKKEGTGNPGVKKEVPIAEHPFAKEKPILKEEPIKEVPIKEMPTKEVPVKEQPIIKETPKAPYTPKMPLQIVPEIDINNYYMTNMTNMTVKPELPPKPANILPEVKEVPKKEMPKKEMPVEMPPPPPPVQEAPCPPVQDYCVPVTPILPGPGFCPPYGGIPMQPYMVQGAMMPGPSNVLPNPVPNMPPNPVAAGPNYMPMHFDDESSAFMPQMPMMNPGFNPGSTMAQGAYPASPAPGTPPMAMDPAAYGGMAQTFPQTPGAYSGLPMGYGPTSAGYGQMPMNYGQLPAGYQGGFGQAPMGYPGGYEQMPAGFAPAPGGMEIGSMAPSMPDGSAAGAPYGMSGMPPYGPTPYGYPQMMGTAPQEMYGYEASARQTAPTTIQSSEQPPQGFPGGSGGDCGCGSPTPVEAQATFVPPTPPIYSAPYTASLDAAQPPFMNPYGMGPVDTSSYGMSGNNDESS